MYVYGGVTLHIQTNKRVPADSEAGLVHAFDFSTYTWSTLRTTGEIAAYSHVLHYHNRQCCMLCHWR
jgi:hypothetical protein